MMPCLGSLFEAHSMHCSCSIPCPSESSIRIKALYQLPARPRHQPRLPIDCHGDRRPAPVPERHDSKKTQRLCSAYFVGFSTNRDMHTLCRCTPFLSHTCGEIEVKPHLGPEQDMGGEEALASGAYHHRFAAEPLPTAIAAQKTPHSLCILLAFSLIKTG